MLQIPAKVSGLAAASYDLLSISRHIFSYSHFRASFVSCFVEPFHSDCFRTSNVAVPAAIRFDSSALIDCRVGVDEEVEINHEERLH